MIPQAYQDYEKHVAVWALRQILRHKNRQRLPIRRPEQLVAHLMFFYPTEPTANDIFNSPKSVCDALEKFAYENDNQLVIGSVAKAKDAENPRVEIIILDNPPDPTIRWERLKAAIEAGQEIL